MPINSIPLENLEQTITRPVLQQIIKQVREATRMKEGVEVFFPGDGNIMSSRGSTLDSDGSNRPVFETGEQLHIEVTEKEDEEDLFVNPMSRSDLKPIFFDKDVGFMLRVMTQRIEYTIEIKFQSKSKSAVKRWRSSMVTRLQQDARQNLHQFDYSVTIPSQYKDLISDIHANREAEAPYGQSLEEYIKLHITDQATIVGNQAGENRELTICHRETRVVGMFDFGNVPDEPEYDQSQGIWSIGFPYKFNWQRPTEIIANYPIIVHNALLPDKYIIPVKKQGQFYAGEGLMSQRQGYMEDIERFEMNTVMDQSSMVGGPLRIPDFDDHSFPPAVNNYLTVFTLLNGVDHENPRVIARLPEDLGDYTIDQDVLDFIRSEGDRVLKPYQSVIHLSYHKWTAMSNRGVTMDGTVMVSDVDLDPRDVHRIRMEFCVNFGRLHYTVIDRFRAHPKAFVKILKTVNHLLATAPSIEGLAEKREITKRDFNYLYALHNNLSAQNLKDPNGGYYIGEGMNASNVLLSPPRHFNDISLDKLYSSLNGAIKVGHVAFSGAVITPTSDQNNDQNP